MKVKDLINKLYEYDPEDHVVVGNLDIYDIEKLPSYYDGPAQELIRDESKNPYYNIVGAKYRRKGYKIQINVLPISEIFNMNANVSIDYSELGNNAHSYKESNDKTIKIEKQIKYECEFNLFYEWAKEKAIKISGDPIKKYHIEDFFKKYYTEDKPLPKEKTPDEISGKCVHDSYNNRRKFQWNKELELKYNGLDEWEILELSSI